MATREMEHATPSARRGADQLVNGPAWAAYLAAGIGAFAMGLIVVLNEVGFFTAPTLYAPSGGVSGRTTIAVIVWLTAWAVIHSRWNAREVDSLRIGSITLLLILLGILGTFPPLWSLM